MKCAKLSVSRWKFGGITSCQGCQNEGVKTNKIIKSHGWNKVKLSRDIIKNTHSRWYGFLQKTIKVWHSHLKMCIFVSGLPLDNKKASASKGRVSMSSHHHHPKPSPFFQLHKCCLTIYFWGNKGVAPLLCVQVAFLKLFGYACYVFNQAKLWVGHGMLWSDHRISDGRMGPIDFHRKAQAMMAPWYFSMAKVASQT